MTVIDPSALLAMVFGEPDAEAILAVAVSRPDGLLLSLASFVEASIVVEARRGSEGTASLARLLIALDIETVVVDREQAEAAVRAWRRFGKGRHPAGLNLGDCFSYALAKTRREPLIFKGEDFSQTDVETP